MPIPGRLLTTAMAVMPHTDVDRALELACSLDIPFWPQLPLLNYREDMYVQASEGFPGILLDMENRTLRFSMDKFTAELEEVLARFDESDFLEISDVYSAVYGRFLTADLAGRPAIRGQQEGPISFGFNVLDQDRRPILFDDTVRPFLLEFMAKRANAQLQRLKKRNENAFLFVDEPGLQFLFSAMSGYGDRAAKGDLEVFFSLIERPRGIHLCGNPDWDFLLQQDLDVLSMDAYSNGSVLSCYPGSFKRFLDRGGTLVWGIVPTNAEPFERESLSALLQRLEEIWGALVGGGIDRDLLLSRSLISPATCCLVNPDKERTVERAFRRVQDLSRVLRDKFVLD